MNNRYYDEEKTGAYIRNKRFEYNYSQSDLAKILGISKIAVSNWENGQALPDTKYLIDLSNIFGVRIDELLFPKIERGLHEYKHITEQFKEISKMEFKNRGLIHKFWNLYIENKKEITELMYQMKETQSDNIAEKILKINNFGFAFYHDLNCPIRLFDIKNYDYKIPVEDGLITVLLDYETEEYYSGEMDDDRESLVFKICDDPFCNIENINHPSGCEYYFTRGRIAILNYMIQKTGMDIFEKYVYTFSQGFRNELIKRFYTRCLKENKFGREQIKVLRSLLRAGCKYFVQGEDRSLEICLKVVG